MTDQRLKRIEAHIGIYPDFPKTGVVFRDIFPLFTQPSILTDVLDLFEQYLSMNSTVPVEAIVGLESRGFLLGPSLALRLNVPFIPVRKAGKLPGKVRSASYELEYGTDTLEVQESSLKPGLKCAIVDDLLATGGSIKTAAQLICDCKAEVVNALIIIELTSLNGRQKVDFPVYSLLQYNA